MRTRRFRRLFAISGQRLYIVRLQALAHPFGEELRIA
jgi:hypothetical protein